MVAQSPAPRRDAGAAVGEAVAGEVPQATSSELMGGADPVVAMVLIARSSTEIAASILVCEKEK